MLRPTVRLAAVAVLPAVLVLILACPSWAQDYIKKFMATFPDYPFQEGGSLNAAGINYSTLKAADALKRLQELESIGLPNN
jgi:hypothetical protein